MSKRIELGSSKNNVIECTLNAEGWALHGYVLQCEGLAMALGATEVKVSGKEMVIKCPNENITQNIANIFSKV